MAGAYSNQSNIQTFIAGGTILAGQAVMLDSTEGQVVVTTGITVSVLGHALSAASSGGSVEVFCGPVVRARVGGAIALGAQVVGGATGDIETFTSVGATGKSCGIALKACSNDGEFIPMLVRYGVNQPPNT